MTVSLSEALRGADVFTDGDWVESKDQDPDGDVRLVQLADIGVGQYLDRSARYLTSQKAAELKCTYLKPGDLLVARMPDPLGRACLFPGDEKPCVTVVDVCVIRAGPGSVNHQWLMHWFNSLSARSAISRLATGTTRKRISRSNLGKLHVPLPPIEEQRRIAAVLDAADAIRAKRRQIVAKLDSLAQAIFLDMFGDGSREARWPYRTLADVCMAKGEYGANVPSEQSDPTKPRYLRITDIRADGSLTDERVSPQGSGDQWGNKVLAPGDVVFARSGATVGKTYLMRKGDEPMVFAGYLVRFVPDRKSVLPEYLYHFTTTQTYWRWVVSAATTVAQPNINATRYGSLGIPVPPLELQQKFADLVADIDRRRELALRSQAQTDSLVASLQQRAFRGEL